MDIPVINGDVTTATTDVIAHCVNCQFVMGSGVAKALKEKWPEIYNNYINLGKTIAYNNSAEWLGYCQLVKLSNNNYCANLFGQNYFGRDGRQYISYDALKKSLLNLRNDMEANNLQSVAFPYKIGAGLAGGDWQIISDIIAEVFENTNINVQFWKK